MRARIKVYYGHQDGLRWGEVTFANSDVLSRAFTWDRLAGRVYLAKVSGHESIPDDDPDRTAATLRALEGRP